jgi:hypothetical protein
VLVVIDEAVDGDAAVGIVGAGATALTVGDTLGVGIAGAAVTPRLPTSVDPNGIPVRAGLLVVVDDVDVGVDDATMLLEPEPHIPEDVDNPDVAEIAIDVDIPDDGMPPGIPPVAGVEVPFAIPIPPPS